MISRLSSRVLGSFHPSSLSSTYARSFATSSFSSKLTPKSQPFLSASFTFQTSIKINTNVLIKRNYAQRRPAKKPVSKPTTTQTQTREEIERQRRNVPGSYQQPGTAQQYQQPDTNVYQQSGQQYPLGEGPAVGHLENNRSLQEFIKRSTLWMGAGVGIAATVVTIGVHIPIFVANPLFTSLGGAVAAMGFGMWLTSQKVQYVREGDIVKAIDSPGRLAAFTLHTASVGLSMTPLLTIASTFVPGAIPIAGVLTACTMGGMMYYALTKKVGEFSKYGPALTVALFSLIGVSLFNIWLSSSLLMTVTSLLGIGIFAGFTAYDTHAAIEAHNAGEPDHLVTAMSFFLNAANLFSSFLRLIMMFWNND